MGYAKNALKAGGVAAGGVFVVCCFIPVVGPLVGIAAGGVTFLVVETGALTAYGIYALGKGAVHGVHNIQEANQHRRERRHEKRLERRERRRLAEAAEAAELAANQPAQINTVVPISTPVATTNVVAVDDRIDTTVAREDAEEQEEKHIHKKHRHRHHRHRKEKITTFFAENEPVQTVQEIPEENRVVMNVN